VLQKKRKEKKRKAKKKKKKRKETKKKEKRRGQKQKQVGLPVSFCGAFSLSWTNFSVFADSTAAVLR